MQEALTLKIHILRKDGAILGETILNEQEIEELANDLSKFKSQRGKDWNLAIIIQNEGIN